MQSFRLQVGSLAVTVAMLFSSSVQSQEAVEHSQGEIAKQFEYFARLADRFEAKLASGVPLKRSGPSILNWTIGSSWQGSFYVWTSDDRPALVGCFLADTEKADARRAFVELHSLLDEPFKPVTIKGIRNYEWNPQKESSSSVAVTDFPLPLESVRLRESQMRDLAGQFHATMYEEASRGTSKEELRLLTKPLYRYPAKGARDGALFAFVTSRGTDPELLLAIECDPKRTREGWSVRPMRFCTRRLDLHRGETIVWSIPEFSIPNAEGESQNSTARMTEPYMIATLLETSTKDFEAIRERTLAEAQK